MIADVAATCRAPPDIVAGKWWAAAVGSGVAHWVSSDGDKTAAFVLLSSGSYHSRRLARWLGQVLTGGMAADIGIHNTVLCSCSALAGARVAGPDFIWASRGAFSGEASGRRLLRQLKSMASADPPSTSATSCNNLIPRADPAAIVRLKCDMI
eukprot:CAMPEP_0206150216 /NCGR_PEP_ID=MMETSP1473-20131121/38184_1 /ASSEMBLY_ACC=CAM_ASM_001109 /TAXON_ID=1461547 /ORGANISM="Stichococcus sp, Strain RCC1054" /LENGTH=152 /DNA_ID=CAMNT_0053547709 /DNA_START=2346 /DNA_END=2805 /DNA_ORIENTATION=+